MPKRDSALFIVDIIHLIGQIKRFSQQAQSPDQLMRDDHIAAMFCKWLESLGEALKNILNDDYCKKYSYDYWRDIVSMRNMLSHEYFGIDYTIVYNVIHNDLPQFESDFTVFARTTAHKLNLKQALSIKISDDQARGRADAAAYLTSFLHNL